jgi:hypothetical protein
MSQRSYLLSPRNEAVNEAVNETLLAAHSAPERGRRASIWLRHLVAISVTQYGKKPTLTLHDGVEPAGSSAMGSSHSSLLFEHDLFGKWFPPRIKYGAGFFRIML